MIDLWVLCSHPVRCINLNYIKSRLQLGWFLGKVHGSCGDQSGLFTAVHKLQSLSIPVGFSQLDFHENQIVFMLGDNIDFAESASIASGKDSIAPASQIGCGELFSPGTDLVIPAHKTFSEMSCGESDRRRAAARPRNGPLSRRLCGSQSRTGDIPEPSSPYIRHG